MRLLIRKISNLRFFFLSLCVTGIDAPFRRGSYLKWNIERCERRMERGRAERGTKEIAVSFVSRRYRYLSRSTCSYLVIYTIRSHRHVKRGNGGVEGEKGNYLDLR